VHTATATDDVVEGVMYDVAMQRRQKEKPVLSLLRKLEALPPSIRLLAGDFEFHTCLEETDAVVCGWRAVAQ
jgi:hypothetical protein